MFKEKLLIGQYYPSDSPLHHLNARTKIICSLLFMICLFIGRGWYWWGGTALLAVGLSVVSRVPVGSLLRGMRIIVIFALFTMVLNFFVYPGEQVLWSWRSLSVSKESLSYGAAMGLRLVVLIMAASLLTLTTTPIELTDALEDLLTPLKRVNYPAHETAMMMSIALRFIPTILEEFDRIVLAQRARGANVGRGGLKQKLSSLIPLIVPLFVSAFRRADDLAQAMEAKCYRGGEGRTRWKVQAWRWCDTAGVVAFVLLFAFSIVLRAVL